MLPPYRPPPAVAVLPPPPATAELPSPPATDAAGAPLQYWHQCPHHHFACCHHHPHGSHSLNQAAEVRDEAWGEEEDKPGEPYSTLKTHILIISIINSSAGEAKYGCTHVLRNCVAGKPSLQTTYTNMSRKQFLTCVVTTKVFTV